MQQVDDDSVLKSFIDLCESSPKFLRPHIGGVIELCLKVTLFFSILKLKNSSNLSNGVGQEEVLILEHLDLKQRLMPRSHVWNRSPISWPKFDWNLLKYAHPASSWKLNMFHSHFNPLSGSPNLSGWSVRNFGSVNEALNVIRHQVHYSSNIHNEICSANFLLPIMNNFIKLVPQWREE